MNVRVLEIAQRELEDAITHYNEQTQGLGGEFLLEALAAIERIRKFPEGWHPMAEGLRRCLLRRFPYGLMYRTSGAEVVIVAVAHTRRRPEYWRDRI